MPGTGAFAGFLRIRDALSTKGPGPLSRSSLLPIALAALAAASWVLLGLDAPLTEDALFWWAPQGLIVAERGLSLSPAGELPALMRSATAEALPQWAGGIPDYAHPPLWFWWLGLFFRLFGPTVTAAHLACLLPAAASAAGFAALGARVAGRWSGLAVLLLPPYLAQLLRPELDLPLLAVVPWALLALVEGRWGWFFALGLLAPWCKEPGVLLALPAFARALQERRLHPAALAPLLGLGLWALVGPGLARPEHSPASALAWLADLRWALQLVFVEQGRWALLLGAALGWRGLRYPPVGLGLSFGLGWLLFFSGVAFFVSRTPGIAFTHVRYFLPGMCVLVVILAGRLPFLALLGLPFLRAPSPFGPEASLWGQDAARAEQAAAPWIAARLAEGERVWVGSYQAAGLSQPWAGYVAAPLHGLSVYGPDTLPAALAEGDLFVVAAYGEPAGRLGRELPLRSLTPFTVGEATLSPYRVGSVYRGGPPEVGAPPPGPAAGAPVAPPSAP